MATDTIDHVETVQMPPKKRKARWSMDATLKNAALVQMALVVADKTSSHAAACKASAVLLRAEAQNQRDEQRRKKTVVKEKVPVLNLGWGSNKVPESEVASKIAEFKRQWKETRRQEREKARANGTRRKRARRWNIKPEYRDAMVVRWAMILADPEASQTVKFAVVSLMLRAEAQNQKDEEYRKKNKNRSQEPMIVGFTEDFYGNNAHEMAAERAAAEASAGSAAEANTDFVVAGANKDGDLRPELKQDKVGAASGAAAQRPVDDPIDMDKEPPVAAVPHPTKSGVNVDGDLRPEVQQDNVGAASGAATQRPMEDSIVMGRKSPVAAVPQPMNVGPQSWYATGPPGRRG